jgi:hypothetical protein
VSVIQEAFVAGISTRKMENVLEQMGVERLAKSQISELCTELVGKAEEFRHRALTEKYPYPRSTSLRAASRTASRGAVKPLISGPSPRP